MNSPSKNSIIQDHFENESDVYSMIYRNRIKLLKRLLDEQYHKDNEDADLKTDKEKKPECM